MSDTSGDPLHRSDARTAPSGAQQADLAPVSDQPDEHWEQQAARHDAEEPVAPSTDPMGSQPQPDPADGVGSGTAPHLGTSTGQGEPTPAAAGPAAPPAGLPAGTYPGTVPTGPQPADRGSTEEASTRADLDQDLQLTIAGEMGWSDAGGDHVRSSEISVGLSQATSLGGSMPATTVGDSSGSTLSHVEQFVGLPDAETGLTQFVAAAQGAVAGGQDSLIDPALDQISATSSLVEGALAPALASASYPALTAAAVTGALADGLGQTAADIGGLTAGALAPVSTAIEAAVPGADLVSSIASQTDPDLGAITDIPAVFDEPAGNIPEAGAAPGLLAALFTPHNDTADTSAPVGHEQSPELATDLAPDLDLGGFLRTTDDHVDLGHIGL